MWGASIHKAGGQGGGHVTDLDRKLHLSLLVFSKKRSFFALTPELEKVAFQRRLGVIDKKQQDVFLGQSVTLTCWGCFGALAFAKRMVCSGCHGACYHNAECQHAHWPQHKAECKSGAAQSRAAVLQKMRERVLLRERRPAQKD